MAVMKIFCGCISTKSGTLGILAVYILLAIAEIVFTSMKIDENNFDDFERFFDIPEECNGDKNGTWWCKAIKNEDGYEKNSAIVKLVLNIILLIVAAVAVYGTSGGKPMFMLPFIVYEFLGLMLWAALVTVTVVIMAVYEPGGVDLSTTVSVGVIGTIIILLLFYVWLCVVSHYQILREVQSYGSDPVKIDMSKEPVPPALLMKGNEKEITREEETTVILQLDILRGIHSDLHLVGGEINQLLGFQMLVNLVTNVVIVCMFGFYTVMGALDNKFYWPFLVILITPVLRIMLVGHWAQVMKDTSMKPFWTMSQMSTLDGSPKLERQVQKFSLQASQKTARITAAGYFNITRNTITKVFGIVAVVIFILVKFDRLERAGLLKA